MLRAHLSPVERLCEAKLTKRSTSEVGLGATVAGVSLIRKPGIFSPAVLCADEKHGWAAVPASPGNGKAETAQVRVGAPFWRVSAAAR